MSGRAWRQLLDEAERRLGSRDDARRLVERASGCDGPEYLTALDEPATPRTEQHFVEMVERRANGEPLQYVVGRWGFRRLDLYLDRRVLIPRPETEMVVQMALGELGRLPRRTVVVDLGTGSGAIALSFAVEVPNCEVWATDRSAAALQVARANLSGVGSLAATRVRLVQGSWFDALPVTLRGRVDLVVSNPPYIADGESLPPVVDDWEPSDALRAGPTGLEDIEVIVKESTAWLRQPGAVVVEIAPHQSGAAVAVAQAAGFAEVEVRMDLSGRERVVIGRL